MASQPCIRPCEILTSDYDRLKQIQVHGANAVRCHRHVEAAVSYMRERLGKDAQPNNEGSGEC